MRTLTYTGERGRSITLGAYKFEAGEPRDIDDDAEADQMLAKGLFAESPAPVYAVEQAPPAEPPASAGHKRSKTSTQGQEV